MRTNREINRRLKLAPGVFIAALIGFTTAAPGLATASDPETLLRELEGLEIEILRADENLRGATARVRDAEGRLEEQESQQEAISASLAERRKRMNLRLRTMYRFRHRGFLPLLFSLNSPHELLRTARYLSWILRADQGAIDQLEALARKQGRITRAIEAEKKRLLEAAGEVYTRQEDLRIIRDERRALVKTMQRSNRKKVKKLLLEGRTPKLDVSIDLREEEAPAQLAVSQAKEQPSFQRSKGRLPMPAMGAVQVTGRGIDIHAEEGSEIRAVHEGTVSRILQINGYGLVLILDHGQGWHTVYTHAQTFSAQAGQRINTGQSIGLVGETGSLEGPRLHFEIRHQRASHDPLEWLQVPRGITTLEPR